MTGKVKWFNNQKGYGFITNEKGHDVFVHYSGIKSEKKFKMLNDGDNVSFDVEIDENGLGKAINVVVIGE